MIKKINWLLVGTLSVCLLLSCAVVWATTFSYTYDTATPAGSDDPAEADDRMREVKAAVQERMNVCGYWPLTGTEVSDADAGEFRFVLFHAPIATTPTVAASHGDLRIKDVGAKAELTWTDEDENELVLTSKGNNLAYDTYLTATDSAGTGSVNLIKSTVGDVIQLGARAVLVPGSSMSTSAAPTLDTHLANKKYVDDSVPTSFWNDSSGESAVFNTTMASANTFEDLDLSGIVGSNFALVFLQIKNATDADVNYAVKPKGQGTSTFARHLAEDQTYQFGACVAVFRSASAEYAYMACATDTSGLVQHGATTNSNTFEIKVLGYIK